MKKYLSLLFLTVPLTLTVSDILFRSSVIFDLSYNAKQIYIFSIIVSFCFAKVFHGTLLIPYKRNKTKFYFFLLGLVGFYYASTLVVTTGYYISNKIMPNLYTLEFVKNEPYNAFSLFVDAFRWYHLALILFFTFLFSAAFHFSIKSLTRWMDFHWIAKVVLGLFILIGLNIFNNNIRDLDQCYVSDVNNVAPILRYGYNKIVERDEVGGIGILSRNPTPIKTKSPNPGFNILMIVNESLRWQNMSLYGYTKKTTPLLDSLTKHNNSEMFVFKRPWANASTTVLSFPEIFSGVTPAEPAKQLHTVPLFWDYAKSAGYETFFISPQRHEWFNFRLFFSSSSIDYYFSKEDSPLDYFNDLGINDTVLIDLTFSHIKSIINSGKTFAGVLHLNATHYPYDVEDRFRIFSGDDTAKYNNSIYKNDYVMGSLIKLLDQQHILGNTIIISTSDHGEALGEHGYIGHVPSHYIETVSIPIWIYYPKSLQKESYVSALKHNVSVNVANEDIIPTVLDFLQLKEDIEVDKIKSELKGHSLVRPISKDRPIVITNTNQIVLSTTGLSLIKGDFQYLFRINTPPAKEELYNFVTDPKETNNLWSTISDSVKNEFRKPFLEEEATRSLLYKYILNQ